MCAYMVQALAQITASTMRHTAQTGRLGLAMIECHRVAYRGDLLPTRPQMNSPAAHLPLRPEFDAFLFAPVGEDSSGMPLSVVSLLARLDLDPWQAAAQLAALSPEFATQRMVSILGSLPIPSLQSSDILLIARHLVAMLPHPTPSLTSPLRAFSGSAGTAVPRPHANGLFLAVYLLFVVAAQLLLTQLLPTHAGAPPEPVSGSAPSQTLPALPKK